MEGARGNKVTRGPGPQNAAVGRFRTGSDEVFIWCRSRYNEHQKPFVFDSRGQIVSDYAMDDVAPPGWTARGIEVIHTIDWTGAPEQLACAKERHRSGDVGLFEPLSGRFATRLRGWATSRPGRNGTGTWAKAPMMNPKAATPCIGASMPPSSYLNLVPPAPPFSTSSRRSRRWDSIQEDRPLTSHSQTLYLRSSRSFSLTATGRSA